MRHSPLSRVLLLCYKSDVDTNLMQGQSHCAVSPLVWIVSGLGHVRLCPSAELRLQSSMGSAGASLLTHFLFWVTLNEIVIVIVIIHVLTQTRSILYVALNHAPVRRYSQEGPAGFRPHSSPGKVLGRRSFYASHFYSQFPFDLYDVLSVLCKYLCSNGLLCRILSVLGTQYAVIVHVL